MRRIKVIFIHHKLVCGGAEQALYDLVSLMDKKQFEIYILSMYPDGEWEYKFVDAGIPVIHLWNRRVIGSSIKSFLLHQYRKISIHHCLKHNPRDLVNRLFPKGADIVVTYSNWENDEIGLARGAKNVRFIHGNIESNQSLYNIVMKASQLLPQYDRIICISEESFNSFKKFAGTEKNVRMFFNPLNSDNVKERSRENVDLSIELPVICAVGRLAPEKGYDRLIRIHKRILDQGIPHKLIIVGDGPEREALQQVICETNTSESVIMAGYQSNPYPYMKQSEFLVCSSYTEGLPVIAMEALSLGIPIVSAVPSIAEVFGEEQCGIITDNDDDSLEAGIKKMLSDKEYFEEAKQAAQRRSAFFDGKRMVKEIEDLFIELMEG